MPIDVKEVFDAVGAGIALDEAVRSDAGAFGASVVEVLPGRVTGSIKNRAGLVTLEARFPFSARARCDRCFELYALEKDISVSHSLVRRLENESDDADYLVLPDGKLDLAAVVTADIMLSLPSKFLCGEDCKGLCQVCGANLNEKTCNCENNKEDNPFASLKTLLD